MIKVYVWKAASDGLGHASIGSEGSDVENFYMSWWPNWRHPEAFIHSKCEKGRYGLMFSNAPSFEDRKYDDDKRDEGNKHADYIIEFNSLNETAIRDEINRIKQNAKWHVLGGNSVFLKYAEVEFYSCASLVAHLLQKGGGICANIYDRCTSDRVLTFGSITPESLALVAHVYEKAEKAGESQVALPIINSVVNMCNIM